MIYVHFKIFHFHVFLIFFKFKGIKGSTFPGLVAIMSPMIIHSLGDSWWIFFSSAFRIEILPLRQSLNDFMPSTLAGVPMISLGWSRNSLLVSTTFFCLFLLRFTMLSLSSSGTLLWVVTFPFSSTVVFYLTIAVYLSLAIIVFVADWKSRTFFLEAWPVPNIST